MPTLDDDLTYLQLASESLEDFLLSGDLYWPLAGQYTGHLPRLSLGGLLLASRRVRAHSAAQEAKARGEDAERVIGVLRTRWRVAWERKARREFEARLRQWAAYLDDYRDNPEAHASYYPYEVRLRVMLDLLAEEVGPDTLPQQERAMYEGLDVLLRAVLVPGAFIWDEALQGGFPAERFWYLYGRLRE